MVRRWPLTGRGSISSTKPVTSTGPSWPCRTGARTASVRSLAAATPQANASNATLISAPDPCRLPTTCSANAAATGSNATDVGGSTGNEKYSAMPAPNSTGSHRNQRSCSASRLRTKAASSGH